MSNKIIRLESLSLMDHEENPNDGSIFQTTRLIEIWHPYDEPHFKTVCDGSYGKLVERHSDRDVVSIEYARNMTRGNPGAYIVKLKDGCKLSLPETSFIAEMVEVTDDEQ